MKKPAKAARGVACVLGRILLCSAFLAAILGYTSPSIHAVAQPLAARLAVAPQGVVVAVMIVMSAAILSVVLGYQARIGALALLVFAAATTFLFQGFTFWNVVNAQARQDHVLHLVLNLSVMGAMLLICANGPGEMSFDGRR
jgi:putative oxidoreductase